MLSRGSRGPRLSPRSACLTGLKEEVSTKDTPQRTGFHQALKDELVRSLPYGGWGELLTSDPFFFLKLKKSLKTAVYENVLFLPLSFFPSIAQE